MMKMKLHGNMKSVNQSLYFALLLGTLALITACSVKETEQPALRSCDCFVAQVENTEEVASKVYADANLKVLWHEDDRVGIFNRNTYNRQYKFTGATGDNSGAFAVVPDDTFVTGNELPYAYAVYPYANTTSISNNGRISLTFPSVQEYEQNSFGRGANAMVACASDNMLIFRNLGGYLMFRLYGEGLSVSSLTLSGNNGEVLAGKAVVDVSPGEIPAMEMLGDGALTELKLSCGSPVALGATADESKEFWFVLPPVAFTQGITLAVTLSNGSVFKKTTDGTITITRNKRSRMAALEVKSSGPEPNEIWYTTTDGNAVTLYKTNDFGVNLVSNTYENGRGVMSFNGPLSKVGSEAFYQVKTLETVTLPEGCTSIGGYAFQYCSALKSIYLPQTLISIGYMSLYRCEALESIVLPKSLQSIGRYAFCYDALIETVDIPQSVTSIGGGAFCACLGIKNFTGKFADATGKMLINGTTLIAVAFNGFTSFSVPENIKTIESAVFSHSSLESITLPEGLKTIGSEAFSNQNTLTSIVIPDSVNSIGTSAFRYSRKLKYVKLPASLTTLPYEMFDDCCALEDVVLPKGLKTISGIAFYYCSGLKCLDIPGEVNRIDASAFRGCSSLEKIYFRSTTPPAGADKMLDNTNDCHIYVPQASLEAYRAAEYWSNYASRIQADPDEGPVFEVSPLEINLSGSAQTFMVKVHTNMEYHADIANNSSWITAGNVSSSGSYDFAHVFSVSQNNGEVRDGLISFCDNYGNCHPVTVTQRTYDTSIENLSFVHHSLGMRFTATWCGWCPYMNESFIKARQKLGEKYNYVMLHAASSELPFSGTAALASQYSITGYPTGIVDGRRVVNNSTDTDTVSDVIANYVQETENNYPVVTAAAVNSTLNGRSLSVSVDVYAKLAKSYKITVFLMEDGVVHYQANGGDNYVHDRIARIALTNALGDAFLVTEENSMKSFSYNVDIPEGYNTSNMSILVYVQRKYGNQQVLQSSSGYGEYYIDNSRIVPLGQNAALEIM